MKFKEFKHQPVEPDTYEASMALNQLMRIGKHAIKLHNMIDDAAEMESWVAKKIDLAGDYVKKVYNYTEGEKAGLYDDGGMTEMKKMPKGTGTMYGVKEDSHDDWSKLTNALIKKYGEDKAKVITDFAQISTDSGPELMKNHGLTPKGDSEEDMEQYFQKFPYLRKMYDTSWMDRLINIAGEGPDYGTPVKMEDAGEGHMSKSTLYHTAKYAIELMQMIKPGDDLEGWVQSKLNKAADYLQGVYNYEEYQKLNPYREELDQNILNKHAQVVQKNIDEILAKETEVDDIDTKPGMMRILSKRVNEVEKEMAKETRKHNEGKMSDIDADMKTMSDEDFMKKYKKSKKQMEKELTKMDTRIFQVLLGIAKR